MQHNTVAGNNLSLQRRAVDALDSREPILVDLSSLSRTGAKGPGVIEWLSQKNMPIPAQPNTAEEDATGRWVLRLGDTEHWLLANPMNDDVGDLPEVYAADTPGVYPVYCEDGTSWFALKSERKAAIMAKLCGVDLRVSAFPRGAIVQSSLARVNALIVHHALGELEVFSIFSDSSSAEYLWNCIDDAMTEFA